MKITYSIALAMFLLESASGALAQSRYYNSGSSIGKAPATLVYMSPRCAALNDAIRTAPARGLKYDTINQMHAEYREECAENEREASTRLYQERGEKIKELKEAKNNTQLEKERSALHSQQCDESKRILYNKRARTNLSEGEKADLQRFEENYRSRCQ